MVLKLHDPVAVTPLQKAATDLLCLLCVGLCHISFACDDGARFDPAIPGMELVQSIGSVGTA